ncbi:MAG: class I SAM-dependent methyltransferase [Chloroflexi bacterium]|nr:class I SAM-dependent methyltransferase [Chloroflexota bacterium]
MIQIDQRYPVAHLPGHYYSPIPSLEDILEYDNKLAEGKNTQILGVDLRENEQLLLLNLFAQYCSAIPFPETANGRYRYYFHNNWFSYPDAVSLYSMMRYLSPAQVIEIGSGFSSAAILDTSDEFLQGTVKITFVEPYPERLYSLLNEKDRRTTRIIAEKVQRVDPQTFTTLAAGDILFVDSSHISKFGSDLNYLLFEVLPRLNSGVHVHFHDVFFPFEYPREWLLKGYAWNEAYMLRSFLQFNSAFRIVFFVDLLTKCFPQEVSRVLPLLLKRGPGTGSGGGSIWLRKL